MVKRIGLTFNFFGGTQEFLLLCKDSRLKVMDYRYVNCRHILRALPCLRKLSLTQIASEALRKFASEIRLQLYKSSQLLRVLKSGFKLAALLQPSFPL